VANGIVYIGSYDGYVYALGTSSAPSTTSAPSPSPTPTTKPTPAPTAQTTANPTLTPEPTQAPSLVSEIQPTTIPNLGVELNTEEPINWLILGAIIAAAMIALVSLYVVFKRSD
jgi:hypothetical protein